MALSMQGKEFNGHVVSVSMVQSAGKDVEDENRDDVSHDSGPYVSQGDDHEKIGSDDDGDDDDEGEGDDDDDRGQGLRPKASRRRNSSLSNTESQSDVSVLDEDTAQRPESTGDQPVISLRRKKTSTASLLSENRPSG